MGIALGDNINVTAGLPTDCRYYNGTTSYASVAEANGVLVAGIRYVGLTVNIGGVEYWYRDGISDGDLIQKQTTINVNNGLSIDGDNIVLGGTLTGETSISGSSVFNFCNGGLNVVAPFYVYNESFGDSGTLQIANVGWKITSTANSCRGIDAVGTSDKIVVTNGNGNGLEYAVDYSATAASNPRWIPDAAWVTGQTANSGIGINGTTANGVATYVDSTTVCSEPNLTFNGSLLLVCDCLKVKCQNVVDFNNVGICWGKSTTTTPTDVDSWRTNVFGGTSNYSQINAIRVDGTNDMIASNNDNYSTGIAVQRSDTWFTLIPNYSVAKASLTAGSGSAYWSKNIVLRDQSVTPVNNQVATWTGAGEEIQGESNLNFDGSALCVGSTTGTAIYSKIEQGNHKTQIDNATGSWARGHVFFCGASNLGGFWGYGNETGLECLTIGKTWTDTGIIVYPDAGVSLNYNNETKLTTTSYGTFHCGSVRFSDGNKYIEFNSLTTDVADSTLYIRGQGRTCAGSNNFSGDVHIAGGCNMVVSNPSYAGHVVICGGCSLALNSSTGGDVILCGGNSYSVDIGTGNGGNICMITGDGSCSSGSDGCIIMDGDLYNKQFRIINGVPEIDLGGSRIVFSGDTGTGRETIYYNVDNCTQWREYISADKDVCLVRDQANNTSGKVIFATGSNGGVRIENPDNGLQLYDNGTTSTTTANPYMSYHTCNGTRLGLVGYNSTTHSDLELANCYGGIRLKSTSTDNVVNIHSTLTNNPYMGFYCSDASTRIGYIRGCTVANIGMTMCTEGGGYLRTGDGATTLYGNSITYILGTSNVQLIAGTDVQAYFVANSCVSLRYNGVEKFKTNSTGVFICGTVTCVSDCRLKTNITPINDSLSIINQLNPVNYNWCDNPTGMTRSGLIAQDVQSVIPSIVSGGEEGENLGVDYGSLIPHLIRAVQEQQECISMLSGCICKLEGK